MTDLNKDSLPRHLAIIMDGNGRWAKSRGLPRIEGHRRGSKSVRDIVTACREIGIKVLTLFAFSSQNWCRPALEVNSLMSLLSFYVKHERKTIIENGIRLMTIGETSLLPEPSRSLLASLVKDSQNNSGMILCLSLSYGGREEIVNMAKNLSYKVAKGEIDPSDIDMDVVNDFMWSSPLGPVDLMIRTSGELRISNFLLWSLAYSELYFTDLAWPDFDKHALVSALKSYEKRNRRFGAVL
jgi:undecaprenyl diphosphate synthase